MLKFFRKIRQNLLFEGKSGKYIKYAIGEILLVVIGILIALQINTLHEEVKNRKLEKEYYKQFKLELEENIRNAEDQINYSVCQIANAEIISHALETGDTLENSLDFFIALEHLCKTYPTQYTYNVWTELLSNGKTAVIENQAFREKLVIFNSDMMQTIYLQEEFNHMNLEYLKLTGEVLSMRVRKLLESKIHPVRLLNRDPIPNLPSQKSIIGKLNSIKGVKGFVLEIYFDKEVNMYLFKRHKQTMLEIVNICNKELEEN